MTLYEQLIAAGLPVINASETGEITAEAMTEAQQAQMNDILLNYFHPTEYADLQTYRQLIQQIKDEYTATLATLQQIQDTVSPTNAQVIAAVKFLAKTEQQILKLLRRTLS